MNTVDDVIGLIAARGAGMYGGEAVTQLEHALQCAMQAEAAGATPELITASLLHDFGHLIHRDGDQPDDHNVDDVHQYIAIPFLRPLFGAAVLEPIRLHVDAKRYLCFADPDYWAGLSPLSQHSLELQGGVYNTEQAASFIQQPYAKDAVQLRIWDDRAKTRGLATPDIGHFADILRGCVADPRLAGRPKAAAII